MKPLPGRLVLLGYPLAHSLSPVFQNAALRHAGIDLRYEALETPANRLDAVLDELIAVGGAGNVTIPHKTAVARRCARLTDLARRTGAVNTFWVEAGELVGDNTDVAGFDALVIETFGRLPPRAQIALIGAGGAASAVLAAVEQWPDAKVTIWNRHVARASALAARFADTARVAEMPSLALREANIVVNATPMGLRDEDPFPIPIEKLPHGAAVVDLVYRREATAWVRAARNHGHPAADGLTMLIAQGAAAFERWTGVEPDTEVMRAAVATRNQPGESTL